MRFFKHLLLAASYGFLGIFVTLLIIYVSYLQNRPDLKAWHTVELDEEFTTKKAESIQSFKEYLELEERLFRQLRQKVYQDKGQAGKNRLNRFFMGSMADPMKIERNWNRSFEFRADNPRGGVLLIHGLSDSP